MTKGTRDLRGSINSEHGTEKLDAPDLVGKTVSSSSSFCSHDMTKSIYVGAGSDTRR